MPGYNRLQGSSLPGFFIVLRLAQGLLALLIAILTSIAAGKLTGGTDPKYLIKLFPGYAFCWFAFAWTVVYLPIALFLMPTMAARHKPIIWSMVLESLSSVWWLVTFALLVNASVRLGGGSYFGVGETKASAFFGAVEFVFFCIGCVFIIATMARDSKKAQAGYGGVTHFQVYSENHPQGSELKLAQRA